jgi:hypothetical protein
VTTESLVCRRSLTWIARSLFAPLTIQCQASWRVNTSHITTPKAVGQQVTGGRGRRTVRRRCGFICSSPAARGRTVPCVAWRSDHRLYGVCSGFGCHVTPGTHRRCLSPAQSRRPRTSRGTRWSRSRTCPHQRGRWYPPHIRGQSCRPRQSHSRQPARTPVRFVIDTLIATATQGH